MLEILYYIVIFVFVLVLVGGGIWFALPYFSDAERPSGNFLKRRPKRIGVVQVASLDSRRKLVLIRRDNVEHLIVTGGPVDMLVESGISSGEAAHGELPPRDTERRYVFEDDD